MAKKTEDTTAKTEEQTTALATQATQLPAFMQDDRKLGLETVLQYVRPPRLKIVQALAADSIKAKFNIGDIILMPHMELVAPMKMDERNQPLADGAPIHFVPLFMFVEYITWNPLSLRGQVPSMAARSFDPKSEIARKARDPELRIEKYKDDPKLSIKHVEHLNYIVVPVNDHPFMGTQMVLSFSRGDHRFGTNFANLIALRKAPICGCNFELHAHFEKNNKGQWYAPHVTNPSTASGLSPWVDKVLYDVLREQHVELKTAFEEGRIDIDHSDDDVDPAEAEAAAAAENKDF